jgi:flagellar biosynthesis/type III secretory pathway protein FliH
MDNSPSLSRRGFLRNMIAGSASVVIAATATTALSTSVVAMPQAYWDGFKKGKTTGRKHGYEDGYKKAYRESYQDELMYGYTISKAKPNPYYIEGYKVGYAKGYKAGYKKGSFDGSQHGAEDASDFKDNLRDQMRDCMENGNC